MEEILLGVAIISDIRLLLDLCDQPVVIFQMPRPFPICDPVTEEMAIYLRKNSTLTRCPSSRRADPELLTVLANLGKHFTISFNKLAKFISENESVSVKIFINGRDDPSFKLCHNGSSASASASVYFAYAAGQCADRGESTWEVSFGLESGGYRTRDQPHFQFRCADETNWTGIRSHLTGSSVDIQRH